MTPLSGCGSIIASIAPFGNGRNKSLKFFLKKEKNQLHFSFVSVII